MAYKALSTANLPDPVIDPAKGENPTDYFNTVLYTGTGADQAITGVGFQPDWVWLKARNTTGSHGLFDSVRGATKRLSSNLTAAEDTAAGVNSFDSDGFTLDALNWNDNNDTFVAWNWKAGGSGVSNTDGSITSTVSASTEAGFSIVSYTGNGSSTGNGVVGHGLGNSSPEMIIIKARAGTNADNSWYCWHTGLSANNNLNLNDTRAQFTTSSATSGIINTSPTSTTFGFDSGSTLLNINESGTTYIAYCFHSVDQYSSFGSYTGNGSTDGPFVYTGFRVGWLVVKRTDSAAGWYIVDNVRSTKNPVEDYVQANVSNAEATATFRDHLSNGFKIRNTFTNENASGGTYIYMAFAEQPFKFSNAR